MSRRRPTEYERVERHKKDRERLEQAARELLRSDGWRRWVKVRSTNGLARYSFHNQLLIAMQHPGATYVAGFRSFLALNRCVRKGERAIRILAPMRISTPADGRAGTVDEDGKHRIAFRAVSVFDVSQTEPLSGTEPVPLRPPSGPVHGDSHRHLIEPLSNLVRELGYSVQSQPLDGAADGWCDSASRTIVINSLLPANGQVRVLVHEIAHSLGINYRNFGRRQAEVLVDTVTYVVCGSVGLDVGSSSVPYIAGWGEDGQLDAIRGYAETIDAIARRIEVAITPMRGKPGEAREPVVGDRCTTGSPGHTAQAQVP
jgi:N-terminal domain of anti-restriction factor ArdC